MRAKQGFKWEQVVPQIIVFPDKKQKKNKPAVIFCRKLEGETWLCCHPKRRAQEMALQGKAKPASSQIPAHAWSQLPSHYSSHRSCSQILLFLPLQVELMSGTKSARSLRPWGRRTSEPCRYLLLYSPSQDTQHLSQDKKIIKEK